MVISCSFAAGPPLSESAFVADPDYHVAPDNARESACGREARRRSPSVHRACLYDSAAAARGSKRATFRQRRKKSFAEKRNRKLAMEYRTTSVGEIGFHAGEVLTMGGKFDIGDGCWPDNPTSLVVDSFSTAFPTSKARVSVAILSPGCALRYAAGYHSPLRYWSSRNIFQTSSWRGGDRSTGPALVR